MFINILFSDLKLSLQQFNILIYTKQDILLLHLKLLIYFSQSVVDIIKIVDHLALFQS